ncbi:hypothetical protein SLEP1_g40036 [Rubroshorea leprosula]|uniref:Uncharacterized protein n=1 Tax=Rubroshorea leprosula TaxID=152421 RepID=A0AAV5L2I4_9ROSI|nr:hypothetical protein SLEP1_g40036 [Rubroshorea leprosula]
MRKGKRSGHDHLLAISIFSQSKSIGIYGPIPDITIFSCSKSIPAKTNCMYIDPTIP